MAFIQATPDVPIPSGERFREVRYQIDPTGSFAQIQFKIVLRSTSSSKVPEISVTVCLNGKSMSCSEGFGRYV